MSGSGVPGLSDTEGSSLIKRDVAVDLNMSQSINTKKFLYGKKPTAEELHHMAKGDKMRIYLELARSADLKAIHFGLLGLLIWIVENELLWANNRNPHIAFSILKLIITLSTFCTVYYLVIYYTHLTRYKQLLGTIPAVTSQVNQKGAIRRFRATLGTLKDGDLLTKFILEVVICSIHPLPFVFFWIPVIDVGGVTRQYTSDAFIGVLMLLRSYLWLRWVAEKSVYSSQSARNCGFINNVEVDLWFSLKTLLRKKFAFSFGLFVLVVLKFAYALMVYERIAKVRFDFADAIWLTVITMTSVGYGDLFPDTICGRAVAIVAALTSVVVTGLVVGQIIERLELTRSEQNVLSFIEKIELRRSKVHLAAQTIQNAFQTWKTKGKPHETQKAQKKLSRVSWAFRSVRGYQPISEDVPLLVTETREAVKTVNERLDNVELVLLSLKDSMHGSSGAYDIYEDEGRVKTGPEVLERETMYDYGVEGNMAAYGTAEPPTKKKN